MNTFATKTPITAVASSGAELPAAINVAPATSGERPRAVIEYWYSFTGYPTTS